ncbi:MAG TPA: rhombosortase [Rheinheimera sp.]|nr:rhombosortase [Rheinheimera sp.]
MQQIFLNYRAFIVLALLCLLLAVTPDSWHLALRYSRSGVEQSEYWRLVTGHLLHSNNWHLLMNLGGLLLAALLHGRYFRSAVLLSQWLFAALLISVALYFGSAQIHAYVGLSGLLHAMLMLGAVKDIQLKQRGGYLLFAGLLLKVVYEQWQGPDSDLATLIAANVAIDAHLYGVVSGMLLALILRLLRKL